jgi:8-oxo-dGTP pyrophosphatase MutT (NUDIX family)
MATPDRSEDGYRRSPGAGPTVRSDIVDVYVFRKIDDGRIEFLQLRRTKPPLAGGWHPMMGHIEAGETALVCAVREMAEEVSLDARDPALLGFWQLEQVHPYFLAELDCIVLSARFASQVAAEWSPKFNDEHDASRWVAGDKVDDLFVWPGQKLACREIATELARPESLASEALRLDIKSLTGN